MAVLRLPLLVVALLAPSLASDSLAEFEPGKGSDEPIPDKVGVEVHLSKSERSAMRKLECSMCKAVLTEMHIEVEKHAMTKKGWGSESQVWETSNAMCLALLQKYKLDLKTPKLEKKIEEEDDEMAMAASGPNAQDMMRAMLVLKMGCQGWLEDHGGDTSGFVFKRVKKGGFKAESTAHEFCVNNANLCGKQKVEKRLADQKQEKERLKKRKELNAKEVKIEKKKNKDNPFEQLPEDSKFGIQQLLQAAKDDPLHYLEDDAKKRIRKGRSELRCEVCRAALTSAHGAVLKRPKSMRREYDILPFVDGICEGGKDLSVPAYFGIEPPPLPPTWTDLHRPVMDKKAKMYRLKPISTKSGAARRKWRELSATGKQQPPSPQENEGDLMLTMTCKEVMEPAQMSEALFEEMEQCSNSPGCDAPLAAATRLCRDSLGASCNFAAAGGPKSEL